MYGVFVPDPTTIVCRVPGGYAGTRALGDAMTRLARDAAHDPQFVMWARAIVRDLPSKAHHATARRLLDYVRQHVTYRFDPLGLEWVQDPRHTLLVDGAGDCDDGVTLIAALSVALGYRAVIRFVKADTTRRDEYSHVYPLVGVPDGQGGEDWVSLDWTQATAEPGWEPPYWEKMDMVVA